jgi:hypothetical protein
VLEAPQDAKLHHPPRYLRLQRPRVRECVFDTPEQKFAVAMRRGSHAKYTVLRGTIACGAFDECLGVLLKSKVLLVHCFFLPTVMTMMSSESVPRRLL